MAVKSTRSNSLLQLAASAIILITLNILSSYFFTRLDLTAERRYSLSSATVKLAGELKDVVYIRIYLDGDLPPGFKRLRNATRELLDEYRIYSSENIDYEFIDPSSVGNEKERMELYKQLAKKGLFPTNLEVKDQGKKSEKIIFPGALVSYKNQEVPLQLLKSQLGGDPEVMLNNSIEGLEYEITSAIRKLTQPLAKEVAFLRGHGELSTDRITDAARALSEYYKIDTVLIDGKLKALDNYSAVIIAKPENAFSEKDKFVLDQYVMNGGKLLWVMDKMSIDMDSLESTSTSIALPNNLNLDDQLFRYGVRINADLIMDLQSAPIPVVTGYTGNRPNQQLFPWPFFPLLNAGNNHPVVNNLNVVKGEFASSVDTIAVDNVKKTILLTSSEFSRLQMSPVRVSLNMLRYDQDPKLYNKKKIPTAVLLEGTFTSNFRNRIPEAIANSPEIGFKEKSIENKMIVVADGDIISNYVSKKGAIYPLGYDRFTQQSYGNRNFILNCVDYLCDDSGVIALRGKEIKLRLLDKAKLATAGWLKWTNVLLPLLLMMIGGSIHYIVRKRKYALK